MPTLRSRIIVVGRPLPSSLELGFDYLAELPSSLDDLEAYSLILLSYLDAKYISQLVEHLLLTNGSSSLLLIHGDKYSNESIIYWFNSGKVFSVVTTSEEIELRRSILKAFEKIELRSQEENLLQLTQDQNNLYIKLNNELDLRVQKRQKSLEDSKNRLLVLNSRFELLHQLLIKLQMAHSLGEIEDLLFKALSESFGLEWVRIIFKDQTSLTQKLTDWTTLKISLFEGETSLGSLLFGRPLKHLFTKEETNYLNQIAEIVSLAIKRVVRLEEIEQLKQQWESTFDAISSPLSLIDENYLVHRCNTAFAQTNNQLPENIIGRKCHEVLFSRENPCPNCKLGRAFKVQTKPELEKIIYKADSQLIRFENSQETYYLQIYRDITKELQIERQIIESAKLAELGTIGSSIAHELNNPLAGIINFLQLIKMELPKDSVYADDIAEMAKAADRCKETIENLLGFVRRPELNDWRETSLSDIISHAIKIVDIQAHSIGIKIVFDSTLEGLWLRAKFNLLAQAITHILTVAFDQVSDVRTQRPGFSGELNVVVENQASVAKISFFHNAGLSFKAKNSNLSVEVTQRIVEEHGGSFEFQPTSTDGCMATISLPLC